METSNITSKNQATVPARIRSALGLKTGDTLQWEMVNGAARVSKAKGIDWAWMKLSEESFAEDWLSPEDEEAFRDL